MSSARFITLAKSRVATSIPSSIAVRSISSTPRLQKSAVDAAKDTLKKTDRMVSDAAVGGINKGRMCPPINVIMNMRMLI